MSGRLISHVLLRPAHSPAESWAADVAAFVLLLCYFGVVQVTPLVIDDSLLAMCQTVADVKGWSMQQAAEQLLQNFRTFYQGQL